MLRLIQPAKRIKIQFFSFVFLMGLAACAQRDSSKPAPGPEQFQSKYVKLVKDTMVMMLIENVRVHYGDLQLQADSVLLDKPKHAVTAYGVNKASFKGTAVASLPPKAVLRYTKGAANWELVSQ